MSILIACEANQRYVCVSACWFSQSVAGSVVMGLVGAMVTIGSELSKEKRREEEEKRRKEEEEEKNRMEYVTVNPN